MPLNTQDSAQALNFLRQQTRVQSAKAFNVEYDIVDYQSLVPINTDYPEWASGVDFQVAKNGFINLDVKKIDIKTDVYLNASNTTLTTLKINPYVFGIGYGMKF